MKLIIDHQNVKREIDGPWALCIGRFDAEQLKQILEDVLKSEETSFSYGWIDVPLKTKSSTNQTPKGWTE